MRNLPPNAAEAPPASAERRLVALLLVVVALAAPAVVLRALCAGRSCARATRPQTRVPFCSLPSDLRSQIVAGFRDGRSAHILAVTEAIAIRGGTGLEPLAPPWPSVQDRDPATVPLVLSGTGVSPSHIPTGSGLEDVAPTVAEMIGFRRPHPEVRSGDPVQGVVSGGDRPRLVVEVVWKGVGTSDLQRAEDDWPVLRSLMKSGSATLRSEVGSLPLDPAAALATIGTGGLPREHGIVGTLVLNDQGRVVRAWGSDAPFSVIATLPDDLDEKLGQEPRIGLVGTDTSDLGLIGGNWYIEHDRDDFAVRSRGDAGDQAGVVERILASGYGADAVPDLLGVVMEDRIPEMDDALRRVVDAAESTSDGSAAIVVTATGPSRSSSRSVLASEIERKLEARISTGDVIVATALGGVFVDQDLLARTGTSADDVTTVLRSLRTKDGRPLLADVFPAIAVTFARYC